MSSLVKALKEKYGREFISIEELSGEFGVDRADIIMEVKRKKTKIIRVGKKIQLNIKDVEKLFEGNEIDDNEYQEILDQVATPTVTSEQEISDERIEEVECESDMSKGCVTYVQSSNRWLYQIDLGKTPDGKRIRKSKSFKTEEEAREALEEALKKAQGSNKNETNLKDFLDYYISEINKSKPRTKQGYYCSARQICKIIGDSKVSEVGIPEINKFFKYCTKAHNQASVDKAYVLLNMAFNHAMMEGVIEKHPMRYITGRNKPKACDKADKKSEDKAVKIFEKEELHRLLELAKSDEQMYPMLLLLQYTGMRVGELRALQWKNIDLVNGIVHITNAATTTTEESTIDKAGTYKAIISDTKSKAGVRDIYIPQCVVDALSKWLVDSEKKYKISKKNIEERYVFPSKTGDLLTHSGVAKRFEVFLKKNGLGDRGYHLYMFRHTFCTTLMRNGENLSVIKQMMGDSTTDIILKVYTEVNKKDTKGATIGLEKYYQM